MPLPNLEASTYTCETLGDQKPDWKINRKNTASVTKWNGKREEHKTWATKVKDHLILGHEKYLDLMQWVETQPCRLSFEVLDQISPQGLSLRNISRELWSFLGGFCLTDKLVEDRTLLAAEHNGLELWRSYHEKA